MGLKPNLHANAKLQAIPVDILQTAHFPDIGLRVQIKGHVLIGIIQIQMLRHAHKRKPTLQAFFYHIFRGRFTVPGKAGM